MGPGALFSHTRLDGLNTVAALLRSRANRYAFIGLAIAVLALIAATLLVCRQQFGEYSWQGLIAVHQSNPALWLLDIMPLIFLVWGQYIGGMMSYQAGALLFDETSALRRHAALLQHTLERRETAGRALGLPQRSTFVQALLQEMGHRRGSAQLAVFALGTEQYAEFEQSQGEDAAVALLQQLVERLRGVLGDRELLAHFGQGNFAILLRQIFHEDEARRFATRLQLALDTPLQLGKFPVGLQMSIGVALHPAHGEDPDTLIRHAEIAKFAAASDGQEYRVYEAALEEARSASVRRMAELHAALYHNGLTENYRLQQPRQPNGPYRLRLLPYWEHPYLGRLDEDAFLNLPTRLSLVHGLTLWLCREGLARLADWRLRYRRDLQLVLRLPAAALRQMSLADVLLRLLRSHDLPPEVLTLEFDEAALQDSEDAGQSQLQALHDAGIRLAANGVGEPGASLIAALYFPLQEARLSPRLLQTLQARGQQPLLGKILSLLQAQRQDIVLGDLHDAKQLALLKALPLTWLEGDAIAPCMTPDEVEQWLMAARPAHS